MVRRVNLREDEEEVVINNENYGYEEDSHGDRSSWLPLLVVPLLLGGLLWGLQSYSQNAIDRQNTGDQQFGVGGAPMVTSPVVPTTTMTPTPTPSTNQMMEGEDSVVPTTMVSPSAILDEDL